MAEKHQLDISHLPGRGGATVSESGAQAVVGFWPSTLDQAGSGYVGTARNLFNRAVRTAQFYHEQNEKVKLARVTGRPVELAHATVRQQLARARQKELRDDERALRKLEDAKFSQKLSLRSKVFDYDQGGMVGALNRRELRDTLKAATAEQRAALLKNHAYRAAALELQPEQAGLAQSHFDLLYEDEIKNKFPGDIQDIANTGEGIQAAITAQKAARLAVENELIQSGTTVAEPAAPAEPKKAWA